MDIEFSYRVGEIIECRDPNSHHWHPAIISKLAPYRGQPGYYITWYPVPKETWQSQGGWTYEACMRHKA